MQQPPQGAAAAGVEVADPVAGAGHDRGGGASVELHRLVVGVVVRQVGRHEHHGLRPAPQSLDHRRHLVGGGRTDHDRDQLEVVEQRLEERQLDLEAVLGTVGVVVGRHVVEVGECLGCAGVERHDAERGRPTLRAAEGQTPQPYPVRRAEQDDPPDRRVDGGESQVGRRRDRPRVDEPGMGDDECLRHGRVRLRGHGPVDAVLDDQPQVVGVVGIERSRHRRRTDLHHGPPIDPRPSRTGTRVAPQEPAGPSNTPGSCSPHVSQRPPSSRWYSPSVYQSRSISRVPHPAQ